VEVFHGISHKKIYINLLKIVYMKSTIAQNF